MRIHVYILLLLFIIPSLGRAQQQHQISGTVTNSDGEVLHGATVFVKNTTTGTSTDEGGKFSIAATTGSVLLFSSVGYQSFEHYVSKDMEGLKVILHASSEIEEVLVTTMGTPMRKISNVGAITVVDPKELQVPATSMSNILGGRVAGVINMQTSGEPGRNISEFWIRGIGTFGANASALVLIDGLEGDLNTIDPADVESFAVLKDASATAVYGVRGANGVVLITTKRGSQGKLRLTARANTTFSTLNKMPEYLRAGDYAKLVNEASVLRGNAPRYNQRDLDVIQYGLDKDLFPDVDWQKEIVEPTSQQNTYYVSGSGGSEMARYFLSLNTSQESAAYKMDEASRYRTGVGYNTYAYRTNLSLKLTESTDLFFQSDGHLSQRKSPGVANTNSIWNAQSQLTPLLVPIQYSTGEFPTYQVDGLVDNWSPFVMINYTGNTLNQKYTGKSTMQLSQDLKSILDGLKFRVQGAYDYATYFDERRYVLPEMYRASGRNVNGNLQLVRQVERVTAQYSYSQRQYRKYHLESTLNYDKILGKHRVSGLVFYYMSDSKDTWDIANASSGIGTSLAALPRRYQGISSRLTYGYNDTYLLDVNFGYTGSENFQPGRQFGFFPAIAGGWVPTNYEYVKENMSWLNYFKIRGSYGSVGNDRISSTRFPYMTVINENAGVNWVSGLGMGGITEDRIGADNLLWERALKTDIGIEAQFFNNKFSFTVDFFNDQRNGIFQQRQTIPGYVGLLSLPYGNVGKMRSWGSDGSVAFNHTFNQDWSMTARGNFTFSRNEIQNWEQTPQKYPYQAYSGYPSGSLRGYVSLGLFRDEQDVLSSPVQTFQNVVLPGDIKYKDINGDGKIDTDDMVALSDPTYPRVMYGLGSEVRYKNWTLGFLFKGTGHTPYFHVGQNLPNIGTNGMGYVPFHQGEVGNVLTIVADPANRWIPMDYALANGIDPALAENPDARFPRLDFGYNANNSQLSTFWQNDGWYVRLQELTLNYRFKDTFLRKIGVSALDLQFVGQNLYVWDNVKLWDPEQANQNGRAYPIPARYTAQLYLHF